MNDVDAAAPTLRVVDATGEFAVKVTFSEVVYTDADGTVGAFSQLSDNNLVATVRTSPGTRQSITNSTVTRLLTTGTTPTVEADEVGKVYLITFTVEDGVADLVDDRNDDTATDNDTLDVWVTIPEDAMYNITEIGPGMYGTGNTASAREKFSIVKSTSFDVAGPQATFGTPTLSNGQVTVPISFDEAFGTDGLTLSDLRITGQRANRVDQLLNGTLTEAADSTTTEPKFNLVVTPFAADYGYVRVELAKDAVNDSLSNKSAAASTTFNIPDTRDPDVNIWVGSSFYEPVYGEGRSKHTIEDGRVNFTLLFPEPMYKGTDSASLLETVDFTVMQYGVGADGKVDLTSGVEITNGLVLNRHPSRSSHALASTTTLDPDNPQKQIEYYNLSVPATDMFNMGGQHIKIELDWNRATDEAGNRILPWYGDRGMMIKPHATFDTIPPVVDVTPGYFVDEKGTPNNRRDDTFVPLTANAKGEYVGQARSVVGFKFEFSEPLDPSFTTDDLDADALSNGTYVRDSRPNPLDENNKPMTSVSSNHLTYAVLVETVNQSLSTSVLLQRRSIWDRAGNFLETAVRSTYTVQGDTTPPTVSISVDEPLNCDVGNRISFTLTDPASPPTTSGLAATEAVTVAEVDVSKGWKIVKDPVIHGVTKTGELWLVPMGDGTELGVTSVTITVKADAIMDNAGNKSEKTAPKTVVVGPVITIPPGGYTVVLRAEHEPPMGSSHLGDPLYVGSLGVRGQIIDPQPWDCMPDLTVFFGRKAPGVGGGALVVKVSPKHDNKTNPIKVGSVGISEIMWASDEGLPHGGTPATGRSNLDQAREQWIELHNLNTFPVTVTLFARATNHALTTEADEIDRMSNYNVNNVWQVKGQSGNSQYGTDFVSMQRGKGLDPKDHSKGEIPTPGKNYAHGDFNGKSAGAWHLSGLSYLRRAAGLINTGQLPADQLNYDFVGTPGRSNKIPISTPITRTNVPSDSIVFNEVANRRDQTLEWIELKNVGTGEVNLKNYEISTATAKGTDTRLYVFPNNDNTWIAPGELLLLVDTDPRDNDAHPIAVGYNIHAGNDQALGIGENPGKGPDGKVNSKYTGDAPRYMVTNFAEGGLPDDGNFLLILRNGNDKRGTHEKIIDIAGWSNKLADPAIYTQLWPLKVVSAPDARNTLAVETVHSRQHRIDPDQTAHGDKKDGHMALGNAGYTGIGYKRHAQPIAAHGGTPGQEDTRKNLVADVTAAKGVLTISEIMYDQGDGEYPQWIEIYNSSNAPVNLHSEAGWRLVIQNYDDDEIAVNTLSGTLNFKNSQVQTVLPQQTVLVASTRARNSGSAFFDTRVVFPVTRVFSVWDDARGELFDSKGRATDPILSTEGFYIELIDGKGNVSDGVGNLVKSPNRRVAATKEWELSDINGEMEDMGRSSILRRYREPKGGDSRDWTPYSASELEKMGITAAGWVAAYMTDFREVRETWYGHPDDAGSPGITGGRVLPVSLSKFRPERLDDGSVVVRWITESELNNAGFNILRSETSEGEYTKLNTQLIEGKGTTSERTTYTYPDTSAKPNVVYYYQIQDVSLDGKVQTLRLSRLKGHISAAGKLSTKWAELKALQ